MAKKKFSNDAIAMAKKVQDLYGIPASVTLAQYAVESSYGTSDMAKEAKNYFGITGRNQRTGEFYTTTSGREFRKYYSMWQSFEDYGKLLSESGLYDDAMKTTNVNDFIYAMAETYAPSSDGNHNYAETLLSVIRENNLTQYDNGSIGSIDTAYRNNYDFWSDPGEYVTNKVDDVKNNILGSVVKVIAIAIVVVFGVIFFMAAFDIKVPTAGGIAKEVFSGE